MACLAIPFLVLSCRVAFMHFEIVISFSVTLFVKLSVHVFDVKPFSVIIALLTLVFSFVHLLISFIFNLHSFASIFYLHLKNVKSQIIASVYRCDLSEYLLILTQYHARILLHQLFISCSLSLFLFVG